MKAVVVSGNEARVEARQKIPKLRDDGVLVKPVAVSLNPTDWKNVAYGRASDGCIVGCDYAGVVVEVGKHVNKPWRLGDRIFGCAHGANLVEPEDGVFAEYAVVKGDLQSKIPPNYSYEKAATLPLGVITVGQGLYHKGLKLNLPNQPTKESHDVLIYGGSTATGALSIQYAKLYGQPLRIPRYLLGQC